MRRQGRNIAFAGAGLPARVGKLLSDDAPDTTFLRRTDRRQLGKVSHENVARALRRTFETAERPVNDDALQLAAVGTHGYPFMIQLVGREVWRAARDEAVFSINHVRAGVSSAARKIGALVHAPALADLSEMDRTFLRAMAIDDGPSRIADVAARMKVDADHASQYRHRLAGADMIHRVGHGTFEFSMPYLREFIREHAVSCIDT